MGLKPLPLLAVGALGLGNLLHIIGLASPEWVTFNHDGNDWTGGLWEICVEDTCTRIDEDDKKDWLKACGALAIIGMIAGVVALGMAAFVFFMDLAGKDFPRRLGLISAVASVMAFAFILACVITYAVETKGEESELDFGYSFGLSIAGMIFILVGGLLASRPISG